MTLQEFISETGIVLTSQPADHNPHMEGSERMDNYQVKFRAKNLGNATMRLYFSKGVGQVFHFDLLTFSYLVNRIGGKLARKRKSAGYLHAARWRSASLIFIACDGLAPAVSHPNIEPCSIAMRCSMAAHDPLTAIRVKLNIVVVTIVIRRNLLCSKLCHLIISLACVCLRHGESNLLYSLAFLGFPTCVSCVSRYLLATFL